MIRGQVNAAHEAGIPLQNPHSRRTAKWALWLFLTFGIILCAGYGFSRLADALSTWVLAESKSPAQLGTAVFLVDAGSLGGNTTYFFARDRGKSGATPVRVGGPYASDGPVKLQEAAWSQDGSVIAVRVQVGEPAGKGFGRSDGTYWIDAYDFRKHQAVSEGEKIGGRSSAIERLLAARGGVSSHTLSAPSVTGRSVGWLEARTFDTSNDNDKDLR
jgi:hypothetical protein